MKHILPVLSVILIAGFALAACAPAATPAPAAMPASTEAPTAVSMPTEAPAAKDIVDTAIADGHFTTLVAALKAAGLADTLTGAGPFTVFAPTDDAFKKLPTGTVEDLLKPENKDKLKAILLYHVVSGAVMAKDAAMLSSAKTVEGDEIKIKADNGSVMINDAKVVTPDIQTSNGVIHVIDSVLLPPEKVGTIAEVAAADGRFTTLVAALKAAGLVDTLNGAGPFTVFAPTDDAFKKLPAGTVDTLLKPENLEKLKSILLYHVVSGKVMADQVVMLPSAKTAQGEDVKITVKDGKVYLNDNVQVIVTDVPASNGVIHVIDGVLLPK